MEKKPLFDVTLQTLETHVRSVSAAANQAAIEQHGFVAVICVQLLMEAELSDAEHQRVVSKIEELLTLPLDRATSEGLKGTLLALQQD